MQLRAAAVALCAVGSASLHLPHGAYAQTWPERPVKIIVPLGPGSGVDITARLLGDRLASLWGQSVVVENRPGGDGIVAITAFTATQDDHTLFLAPTSSFTHHPWTQERLPYEPSDLVPIARSQHDRSYRSALLVGDQFFTRTSGDGAGSTRCA